MYSISYYESPLGGITIACDEQGLAGLWFDGQKYFGSILGDVPSAGQCSGANAVRPAGSGKREFFIRKTREWLDLYFSGADPGFTPPLHLTGSSFRLCVWELLLQIPYGKTSTYKEIAGAVAEKKGMSSMSAQAVGGAVGHNPVSIIVPCHRVIGTDGSLTGYAGGIEKKISLLMLEKAVF